SLHSSGRESDGGELVTWLDDAVLFAPSMLLGPAVSWMAVHDEAFDLVLEDRGHRVRARVMVNARGAPIDFVTDDRFVDDPERGRPLRTRWSTPIDRWETVGGGPRPPPGRAVSPGAQT